MQSVKKICACNSIPDDPRERIRRDYDYPIPMQYWEASALLHDLNLLRQRQHIRPAIYSRVIELLVLNDLLDPALTDKLNTARTQRI